MTFTAANDLCRAEPQPACRLDMSVIEFAIFLCVFREDRPACSVEVARTLGSWFECEMAPSDLAEPIAAMIRRGWLVGVEDRFRAGRAGREAARPLMNGVIRMLDQGTRLIDVALMMTVLRLTRGELDAERN